jgi:hypothetical protein
MGFMISYNSLWKYEVSDDVIEHKKCCSSAIIKKCRHSLNPFTEIIDEDDNITMHEIDTPSCKGVDGDNGMEWSSVGTCSLMKYMIRWEFFDGLNAFFEYGRLKITNT